MCGIAGILLARDAPAVDLRAPLQAMAAAMRHRGPDAQRVWVDAEGRAGLANCRLAIRDPKPAAHMPMSSADGAVWLTYNGELYGIEPLRLELQRLGHSFAT